jgi:hypothetical protein
MFTGPELLLLIALIVAVVITAVVVSRFTASASDTMVDYQEPRGDAQTARPVRPPRTGRRSRRRR